MLQSLNSFVLPQNVQKALQHFQIGLFNRGGQAPAITIVARDAKTLSGWVGNSTDWCRNLKVGESIEECVEEHTYSRSNVLKDVFWGFNHYKCCQISILNDSLVAEDYTMVWQGRFLSVEVPRTMVADNDGLNGTRLTLALAQKLTYLIFIHDPDFFEINYKPTFPSILKTVNPEADFNHVYNLGLTEVRRIKMLIMQWDVSLLDRILRRFIELSEIKTLFNIGISVLTI